jgi:hypothetical protein
MCSQRLIAAAVVIALSGALAGCSTGASNWDPTDLLDFLDTKKKLPGERKPVFPGGVPGLEQGVPKDLYKGAAQQQDTPAVAAVQPEESKPQKSAKKGKGKQPAGTPAAAAAPDGEAAPEEEGSTAAAPPAPKPKKIVRRRTTAPPPDPAAPQAAQPAAQPQQAASPFPAPLPGGTFQR